MARPDKAATVAELTDAFREANAAVLTEYRGLTVAQLKELRRSLAGNATYAVVKNTLTKIAAREAGVDTLEPMLEGPSAIAFVTGDAVTVAKGLRDFARTYPTLVVKGGVLDGRPLSADEIRRLADLESREVLLAKLAGAMKASLQQAVSLFAAPLSQAARLLAALEEQKKSEPQPTAPAPEPASAEATDDEVHSAEPEPGPGPATSGEGAADAAEPDEAAAEEANSEERVGDPATSAEGAENNDIASETDVAGDATSAS